MFVVYLEAPDGEQPFDKPFKAFSLRQAAESYATDKVAGDSAKALIYEVPGTDDARKATDAVKMGEGLLVSAKGQTITQQELDRDWSRAMAGNDNALMKFLRD